MSSEYSHFFDDALYGLGGSEFDEAYRTEDSCLWIQAPGDHESTTTITFMPVQFDDGNSHDPRAAPLSTNDTQAKLQTPSAPAQSG